MTTSRKNGRGRSGRGIRRGRWAGGLERLEGRAMLNASIDIAADGSLLYRSDPALMEQVKFSRTGDVYTFDSNFQIDVGDNLAGLTVTGSGTPNVAVTAPTSLRIEMRAVGQRAQIESTGVPTAFDYQAAQQFLTLGGVGGVQTLSGPITVTDGAGAGQSYMIVDDAAGTYDSGRSPEYVVDAGSITSNDPDVRAFFAGITYSGVERPTLIGATTSSAAAPLYLVYGTSDGAITGIQAGGLQGGAASTAPHISILGTSADAASNLVISSNVRPVISLASNSSPVTFLDRLGGPGASIRVEGVRGAGYGLGGDLVVMSGVDDGHVDVSIANYWNTARGEGDANWFLGYDPGSEDFSYAALRDANGPAGAGVYFRPNAIHSLNVDARGNRGASLMVDFRNGNAIPYGTPAPGVANLQPQGLTYVGAAATNAGSPYALSFVGEDEVPFLREVHTAVPLYRGVIELSDTPLEHRRVAYQLDAGAPLFDDALAVDAYSYVYEIMDGTLPEDYRLRRAPDGSIVSAAVPSTLALTAGGAAINGAPSLRIAEENPAAYMATTRVTGKAKLDVLRRWSIASVATNVDYASTSAVAGLDGLYIVDESPSTFASDDMVRLQALPPGAEVYVLQGFGNDGAFVSAPGVAPASLVWLDGGPGTNGMRIDAAGERLRIDDLGGDRAAVVRVVEGVGEVLFLYAHYEPPVIVNVPMVELASVDGVALQAASDVGLDGKPKR